MCNNDYSVKLNLERSFLVKFGIFAPRINFLFYSITIGFVVVGSMCMCDAPIVEVAGVTIASRAESLNAKIQL